MGPRGEEVSTGTTLCAVEFDGGVVIGADSRTSMGTWVANRVTDKLTPVTDNIFCCRSGSAAFKEITYEYRDSLMAGLIVAGYDHQSQGGQVWTVPVGGMCVR